MKDFRTTDNGHFDLEGYFYWSGITEHYGDKLKGRNMLIVITDRDIGKSTSSWNWIMNRYLPESNFEYRFGYVRNNTEKINNFATSFNGKYNPNYNMSKYGIYKVEVDENMKKINRNLQGMVIPLSCYENIKSTITDGYHLIFWDEFNEEDERVYNNWIAAKNHHNLYNAFIDTLKTVERHREDFTVIVMGNKVSTENDILLNLDIVDDENATTDQIFIRDKVVNGELIKIRVVITHKSTFNKINSSGTLANVLASYNEDTDRYLNKGGFLYAAKKDIKSWSLIRDKAQINKHLAFDNFYFELGTFMDDNGEEKYYIHEIKESRLSGDIELLSLDIYSFITNMDAESLYETEDYIRFYEFLSWNLKYKKLYFTTNFAKTAMIQVMRQLLSLTEG